MARNRKHSPDTPRDGNARSDSAEHGKGERLQKVLAAAGVGSRRDCEELIREGRVEVDRQTVTELGTRVDPLRQEIRVDGEPLKQPKRLYYAVNKPVGVVTTSHDPSGRARVIDLVPTEERVFAVGRLDRASEGLILVTNDGEFANRITHPRYGVEKTYLVRVAGAPDHKQLDRLKRGVHLAEGFAKAQAITVKKKHGQSTDLVIVLNEGRNREIRRILARVGHKVLALKRVAVGPVKLANLAPGEWRRLMPAEVDALLAAAKEKRREAKGKPARPRRERPASPEAAAAKTGGERRVSRQPKERQYLQKEALLAEPLSLDDLLRDDLDEGPLGGADEAPLGGGDEVQPLEAEGGEYVERPRGKGGVIDYGEDFSPPSKERRPSGASGGKRAHGGKRRGSKSPGGKRFGRKRPKHAGGEQYGRKGGRGRQGERASRGEGKPRGKGDERGELEALPRESYGRKRGGKRVFGPPHEGRGPAGETGGNFQFRPKKKGGKGKGRRPEGTGQSAQMQSRRGKSAGKPFGKKPGKKFGKFGGKRKGRP